MHTRSKSDTLFRTPMIKVVESVKNNNHQNNLLATASHFSRQSMSTLASTRYYESNIKSDGSSLDSKNFTKTLTQSHYVSGKYSQEQDFKNKSLIKSNIEEKLKHESFNNSLIIKYMPEEKLGKTYLVTESVLEEEGGVESHTEKQQQRFYERNGKARQALESILHERGQALTKPAIEDQEQSNRANAFIQAVKEVRAARDARKSLEDSLKERKSVGIENIEGDEMQELYDSLEHSRLPYWEQRIIEEFCFFRQENIDVANKVHMKIRGSFVIKEEQHVAGERHLLKGTVLSKEDLNNHISGNDERSEKRKIMYELNEERSQACEEIVMSINTLLLVGLSACEAQELYDECENWVRKLFSVRDAKIELQTFFVWAYLAEVHSDLDIALRVWRDAIRYCNERRLYIFKVVAYKRLAEVHLRRLEYARALLFAKKLLRYAWLYSHSSIELYAYELIARIYFYLNDFELSQYFHDRGSDGKIEAYSSAIRAMAISSTLVAEDQSRRQSDEDTSEEDNFDLNIFLNAKFIKKETHENGSSVTLEELEPKRKQKTYKEELVDSLHRFRINNFKVSSNNKTNLYGIALIKSRFQEPLGAEFVNGHTNAHLNQSYLPTEDSSLPPTQNKTKFIPIHLLNLKNIQKAYLLHLSPNRQIDPLCLQPNAIVNYSLVSKNLVARPTAYPMLGRLLRELRRNIEFLKEHFLQRISLLAQRESELEFEDEEL